jgi:hypothetical protein
MPAVTEEGEEESASPAMRQRAMVALRIEGWVGTSTLWQLAALAWLAIALLGYSGAFLLYKQGIAVWPLFVAVVFFSYGYVLMMFPGLLFGCLLPVPAIRGDTTAAMGIVAWLANAILYQVGAYLLITSLST